MVSIGIILVLIALCFYIGILYTNQVIVTIGYVLGLLFLISIMELIYRHFTVKCHIEVPISMAERGKPVGAVVKIQNKSVLPTGKIEVKIETKNIIEQEGTSQWIFLADVSGGGQKLQIPLIFDEAGCHEISISGIKIHSLFGLIHLKKKCRDFSSVLIMPDMYATNVEVTESVRNFLGDADVYDEFRPGHDSGETFEIREYREKDKLQSIHWKLSAKMDELMVKENSLPKACAIVLLLEIQPKQKSKKRKMRKKRKKGTYSGAYLELVASLSYSLMDQKCPHFVAWYSTEKDDIRRIRVDDEESFYIFLNAYLREACPVSKKVRDEYRRKYKNEWYLHDIVVNEKLELYKDGALLTKLDEKKLKDECEKLELLL